MFWACKKALMMLNIIDKMLLVSQREFMGSQWQSEAERKTSRFFITWWRRGGCGCGVGLALIFLGHYQHNSLEDFSNSSNPNPRPPLRNLHSIPRIMNIQKNEFVIYSSVCITFSSSREKYFLSGVQWAAMHEALVDPNATDCIFFHPWNRIHLIPCAVHKRKKGSSENHKHQHKCTLDRKGSLGK